jgi:hypothetical protein
MEVSPQKKRYEDFGMEIPNILNANATRFVGILERRLLL